ncbi:FecR family protein [Campylobacter sp. MG1]|uniref:FecR family protein n=1 Tax=Campylobacter sp. MG1 TaxID=2976332 RepID=UPI00226D08FD|nr:FecR family protein [Campylobacter sp. MG1]
MKKLILLLSIITLSYASVGKISAIRGDALVVSSNGNSTKAILNQELDESDIIKTLDNARLQIIFSDNTITTLGKNTTLEIKQYLIDGKNSKVNLEVNEGSFKVITGEISKLARNNFKLKAHTATIGIRGTIFIGEISNNVNKLACLQGAIDVRVGNNVSLIHSGKQVSIKNNKITNIQDIRINEFDIAKTIKDNNNDETDNNKDSNKDNNSQSNNNKVKSITLSSALDTNYTNNTDKNIDNTNQDDIQDKTIAMVDNKINNTNNNNSNNNTTNEENNNSNNQSKPNTDTTPVPDTTPKPDTAPVPNPVPDTTPVNPNDKYFTSSDNGVYYYGTKSSNNQTNAELNLFNRNLSIYNKTNDDNGTMIKEMVLNGANGTYTIKHKYEKDNNIFNTQTPTGNLNYSSLDGKTNYIIKAPNTSELVNANKESIIINILGENFNLQKDNNVNYNAIKNEWLDYEKNINKDFDSNKDINYFYENTENALMINPSSSILRAYVTIKELGSTSVLKLDVNKSISSFILHNNTTNKNYDGKIDSGLISIDPTTSFNANNISYKAYASPVNDNKRDLNLTTTIYNDNTAKLDGYVIVDKKQYNYDTGSMKASQNKNSYIEREKKFNETISN